MSIKWKFFLFVFVASFIFLGIWLGNYLSRCLFVLDNSPGCAERQFHRMVNPATSGIVENVEKIKKLLGK